MDRPRMKGVERWEHWLPDQRAGAEGHSERQHALDLHTLRGDLVLVSMLAALQRDRGCCYGISTQSPSVVAAIRQVQVLSVDRPGNMDDGRHRITQHAEEGEGGGDQPTMNSGERHGTHDHRIAYSLDNRPPTGQRTPDTETRRRHLQSR